MPPQRGPLTFDLTGPFHVSDAQGVDRTPRAAKAQGLLLLLLEARHLERARAFLQDKLWSDRQPEQGAQSLRQCLKQIRRAFGPQSGALRSDRRTVGLDADLVRLRRSAMGQMAEGLDVRDPEFEDWLAAARSASAGPGAVPPPARPATAPEMPPAPGRLRIAVRALGSDDPATDWVAMLAADALAATLGEQFDVDLVGEREPSFGAGGRICALQAFRPSGDMVGLRAAVARGDERRLWNGHRIVPLGGLDLSTSVEIQSLVNETTEAVADSLIGLDPSDAEGDAADRLCRLAIRHMFAMTPEDAARADALLGAASERSGKGLYLAWRAQLRVISWVERYGDDGAALRDESSALVARALEREPNSSMVLALGANVHGFLGGDRGRSLEMARRATRLNPSNPMAWWAASSASLYTGDVKSSLAGAERARDLARLSPHSYWWEMQVAGAALLAGDANRALGIMRRASAIEPNYRPTLRYIIGLYAWKGDVAKAVEAAERLRAIEPDFSIDRLVHDETYPASLLRRAPNLDLAPLSAMA